MFLLPEEILDSAGDSFLLIIVPLLVAGAFGFIFGWSITKLIAEHYLGWGSDRIKKVFSKSEVPHEWIKENEFHVYREEIIEYAKRVDELAHRNQLFLACRTALISYLIFSIYIVVIHPFLEGLSASNWSFFLWPGPLIGIVMGTIVILENYRVTAKNKALKNYISTSSYLNESDEQSTENEHKQESLFSSALNYTNLVMNTLMTLLTLSIALLMLHYAILDDSLTIPSKDSLRNVSGHIDTAEKKGRSVRFFLSGNLTVFVYPKNFGSYDKFLKHVSQNKETPITILIAANQPEYHRPSVNNEVKVYELVKDGRVIRAYEDVRMSSTLWKVLMSCIGLLMFLFSGLMAKGTLIQFNEER